MATGWQGSTRRQSLPKGWDRIRAGVLERDSYRCTWIEAGARCPAPGNDVDHIVAHSQGGSDEPANLRSLCRPHHAKATGAQAAAARAKRPKNRREPEPHPGLLPRKDIP